MKRRGERTISEHDFRQKTHGSLTSCVMGSFPGNSDHDCVRDDLTPANEYRACGFKYVGEGGETLAR